MYRILLPTLLLIVIAGNVQAQDNLGLSWENGFQLKSPDSRFKIEFGGRLMYDFAVWQHDQGLANHFGKGNNGMEFRRARLFSKGLIYGNIAYKLELDFAGGEVEFKDVFMELRNIPLIGNFQIGHFKEPLVLENLTSSKYITFIERSFPDNYGPGRNTGAMLHNTFIGDRLGLQLGVFRNADDAGNDVLAGDGVVAGGRVAGAPIWGQDGKRVLHLGAAYSYRRPDDGEYEVGSRPEAHLAPEYIAVALDEVDHLNVVGLEASLIVSQLSLQGEMLQAAVVAGQEYHFNAWYGMASFFLTGENRSYKGPNKGFDKVQPKSNFGENGGIGAWEVALRLSRNNLNSKNISGGHLTDITAGLNWYLNPAARIMFNYVNAHLLHTGRANIFQMRFQVDF